MVERPQRLQCLGASLKLDNSASLGSAALLAKHVGKNDGAAGLEVVLEILPAGAIVEIADVETVGHLGLVHAVRLVVRGTHALPRSLVQSSSTFHSSSSTCRCPVNRRLARLASLSLLFFFSFSPFFFLLFAPVRPPSCIATPSGLCKAVCNRLCSSRSGEET